MTEARRFGVALCLPLLVACSEGRAAAHSGDAERGRATFDAGVTPGGGTLVGRIGADAIELRGSTVACARCHGAQGQGREAGESAPAIQGRVLFAPAGRTIAGRGPRPAYDAQLLARAIREGRSSSGRQLSWMMPRFDLDDAAMADLAAHLARLGETPETGVFADRIVVGSALPHSGPLAPVGADVQGIIEAVFDDVAAEGGIFGRRLALRVEDAATGDAAGRLLDAGVFALVASVRGGEQPSDSRLEAESVPLVAPITPADDETHPSIFWLLPGPAQQARWAVQQLARADTAATLSVVARDDPAGSAWADAVIEEAARWELPVVRRIDPESAVPAGVDAVLFSGSVAGLLQLDGALPPDVRLIAPASLAVREAAGAKRAHFVQPAIDEDPEPQAFYEFLRRHALPARHVGFQASAWASARILVEALRRAGAQPTRAELVRALESLRDFHTGVLPPVSFGSHRRLGVAGARFVRFPAGPGEPIPVSPWRSLVLR